MIYYYVKSNGDFGEQVTAVQPVAGSSNFNYVYVFWDNSTSWINKSTAVAYIKFYLDDGTETSESSMTIDNEEIDFTGIDNIDLKFFEENTTYKFAKYAIPSTVLSHSGWVKCVVRIYESSSQTTPIISLSDLTFKVNGSYVYDSDLSESQYNYLLSKIVSGAATWGNITGTLSNQNDLNTALNAKLDKAVPTAEQGTKEFLYTFAGNTQKTDIALINDMTSSIEGYTDSMVPTALSVKTVLSYKEDASNKVTTLSSSSTDTQYPSAKAVYDNLQDVLVVAQGKENSYALYYEQEAPTSNEEFELYTWFTEEGTQLNNLTEFNAYVSGRTLNNSVFNSQLSSLPLYHTDNYYYLLSSGVGTFIVFKNFENFKTGDVIYVNETNVPDRWLSVGTNSTAINALEVSVDRNISNQSYNPVSNIAIYNALANKSTLYKHTLTSSDIGLSGFVNIVLISPSSTAISSGSALQTLINASNILSSTIQEYTTVKPMILVDNTSLGIYAFEFSLSSTISYEVIPTATTFTDTVTKL